ncbi:MAG: sec-independent protein translocase protein TatA [Halieaceae bacterium]|jgi:sec-independent protein translocase protein TatA
MGLGGIGIWQLLIILVIVIMLFGTKRLRTMGGDLGTAIKGFRSSIKAEEPEEPSSKIDAAQETSETAEKPVD